ncbi:diguanylate cyclase domain-containing protein [[Limnothrix rosea] IAM M-220]|uniref:diguanylate cyclase domain-containing protein n=1 Tax=[Limnothrix rosea] IAM M-220 TaxID=454133 RepID=UPI0009670CD8|nr:diguanylate cyclase [[Limnothrix rosea] IAM M-220]OKH14602.1 bifunctional diguanylate cyclase/phosphodiesterase [[Limnothrix rosea] IAM M-220]
MSQSASRNTSSPEKTLWFLLLQSYGGAIAKIQEQAEYINTIETSLEQTLGKYHEAMHQYHDLKEQFDHQYSQQYQQYFSLPIPCYNWQYIDETLQLVDFNPAAAKFSRNSLEHQTISIGHKPEKLFLGLPALYRYLVDCYESKSSSTYHLEFDHLQIYLKVDYVYLEPDQVLMFLEDESERVLTEQKLRQKAKQQSTIARLGQLSLETTAQLDRLFCQSVTAVARILDLPFACLYRSQPNTSSCLLEAGYGWADDLIGLVTVSKQPTQSHVGHTLATKQTVVIEDLRLETRFKGEALLHNHRIVSGVSVLIGSGDHLWGVLAVYSLETQVFSKDQIYFLQAIANILATAVTHHQQTQNMNLLHRSIDAIEQGVVITDPQQVHNPIIYANEGFAKITGYDTSEIVGQNCNFLQGQQTQQPALDELRKAILRGQPCRVLLRNYRKTGDLFWNELQIFPVRDDQGYLTHFIGIQTDVTERRAVADHLYQSDFQFRQTFNLAPIGMAITDLEGRYETINQSWCHTLGYEPRELQGTSYLDVTHPDDVPEDLHQNLELKTGHIKQFQREKRYLAKNGQVIHALMQAVLVETATGEPLHVIRQMVDISDRKQMEKQLIHDALYDPLTNLPNRSLLQERLKQSFKHHQRYSGYDFAVLFLDLDHFKWINDSLGHQVGDQLLQAFALRVQDCLRETDTLARLGGDEFVILLDEIHHESYALQIAQRIHGVLQQPFRLAGQDVFVNTSIGIVQGSHDYQSPDALLQDADVAMYQAKSRGRSRSEVFDRKLQTEIANRRHLEQDLREAIADQGLAMRYRPIFSLEKQELVAVAAQIHWFHPRNGWVDPEDFWAIATETGLSRQLLRWGFQAACQDFQQWQVMSPTKPLKLHMTMSSKQLRDPQLVHLITDLPQTYNLSYEQLVIEFCENLEGVTETEARQHLVQLRTLGVCLYLGHFGETNLVLSPQYHQLIQGVVIAATVLKDAVSEQDPEVALFEALVHLAHSLDLNILVQDIQTEHQRCIACNFHCGLGQGQLFGAWQTQEEIARLLQSVAIASP